MTGASPDCGSYGARFRLTLITANPALAEAADRAGVDRIGLDLERLGKAERQAGTAGRLSAHDWADFAAVAPRLGRAALFARLDPLNAATPADVERALAAGVRVLMLPFFHTAHEVGRFVRLVDGRAEVVALLETAAAALRIRDVVAVPGVGEVMIGLNDLRLQFGVGSHFEVLASPLVDALAAEVRRAGVRLSLGGLAHPDNATLPIPPDLVYAQLPRLGATGAWIARSLVDSLQPQRVGDAIQAMRRRLDHWASAPAEALERAHADLAERARRLGQEKP
ncbi:MAG: aldolase/citrate lyase family protein [Alphaproteobacteria bacterium]|nr:aldolase/citrate lyase family protein [Alphaproteobacteria bacterium]